MNITTPDDALTHLTAQDIFDIDNLSPSFFSQPLITIPPPSPTHPSSPTLIEAPTNIPNVAQIVLSAQAEKTQATMAHIVAAFEEFNPQHIISEPLLLDFFTHQSKKYSPNSLWPQYSLLKKYILWQLKVDIGKCSTITQFLKTLNKGYKPKKAKPFTRKQIYTYLDTLTTPENAWKKMVVNVELYGCLRGCKASLICFEDITEDEAGLTINVDRTKTKEEQDTFIPKIPLSPHDPSTLYHYYISLIPLPHIGRLFHNFQKGKYTKQPIRKNKITKIACEIATQQNLLTSEKYTGHSFRATAATIAADAGISTINLKHLGG
jgi:integrase